MGSGGETAHPAGSGHSERPAGVEGLRSGGVPASVWSGWPGSNRRPPGPKPGALPLRYTPVAPMMIGAPQRSGKETPWRISCGDEPQGRSMENVFTKLARGALELRRLPPRGPGPLRRLRAGAAGARGSLLHRVRRPGAATIVSLLCLLAPGGGRYPSPVPLRGSGARADPCPQVRQRPRGSPRARMAAGAVHGVPRPSGPTCWSPCRYTGGASASAVTTSRSSWRRGSASARMFQRNRSCFGGLETPHLRSP